MLRRLTQTPTVLRHWLQPRNIALAQNAAPASTTAAAVPEKWDLFAGVLVERLPIVSKALNPLEQQFQELLWRVEYENSLKSKHEMQHELELHQAVLLKKGQLEVDLDENASKLTAQDLKDAYVEEFKQFKVAPRTTADDKANNLTSTNRCLDDTLYLLVEQQLGSKSYMLLPQGRRHDGETMRQTAERVLHEHCGAGLRVKFYGNAPCGFYKYKYPRNAQGPAIGAKVFFYRAAWLAGNVTANATSSATAKKSCKFEWLSKTTLTTSLTNDEYSSSIQRFLL